MFEPAEKRFTLELNFPESLAQAFRSGVDWSLVRTSGLEKPVPLIQAIRHSEPGRLDHVRNDHACGRMQ
jgi:hypothetical protein